MTKENKFAGILRVAIYLRKSRADEELEKELGQGETLARHRKALLQFSKENKLNIVNIYEELESGDSIIHRPAMLELLKHVEAGMYDAVLVMDIYRLGRGDQQDQGLILNTFKNSNTKILTPDKYYDLNDEFDEDYAEFESFMGRKEYKMIKKRLQGGRARSVQEGNYIGTYPPYGYVIYEEKHTRTLQPHPDQAPVVKMIFDMYVNQAYGCARIAEELNTLGIKSYTGKDWEKSVITNLIKNQVYIGKVVWKKKCIRKSAAPGKKKDVYTRDKKDWIVAEGKHPPLVDEITFRKAQDIINSKYHIPYQIENGIHNPLAGLIICGKCGYAMVRRPYAHGGPHLVCVKCDNKSSLLKYVEDRLLQMLELQLGDMKVNIESKKTKVKSMSMFTLEGQLASLDKELKDLQNQKINLHDLLERGVYTVETFLERSQNIAQRIEDNEKSRQAVLEAMVKEKKYLRKKNDIIPSLQTVIDTYYKIDDVVKKNLLLKSVIEKVEYVKNKDQFNDDFSLKIYPKTVDISGLEQV